MQSSSRRRVVTTPGSNTGVLKAKDSSSSVVPTNECSTTASSLIKDARDNVVEKISKNTVAAITTKQVDRSGETKSSSSVTLSPPTSTTSSKNFQHSKTSFSTTSQILFQKAMSMCKGQSLYALKSFGNDIWMRYASLLKPNSFFALASTPHRVHPNVKTAIVCSFIFCTMMIMIGSFLIFPIFNNIEKSENGVGIDNYYSKTVIILTKISFFFVYSLPYFFLENYMLVKSTLIVISVLSLSSFYTSKTGEWKKVVLQVVILFAISTVSSRFFSNHIVSYCCFSIFEIVICVLRSSMSDEDFASIMNDHGRRESVSGSISSNTMYKFNISMRFVKYLMMTDLQIVSHIVIILLFAVSSIINHTFLSIYDYLWIYILLSVASYGVNIATHVCRMRRSIVTNMMIDHNDFELGNNNVRGNDNIKNLVLLNSNCYFLGYQRDIIKSFDMNKFEWVMGLPFISALKDAMESGRILSSGVNGDLSLFLSESFNQWFGDEIASSNCFGKGIPIDSTSKNDILQVIKSNSWLSPFINGTNVKLVNFSSLNNVDGNATSSSKKNESPLTKQNNKVSDINDCKELIYAFSSFCDDIDGNKNWFIKYFVKHIPEIYCISYSQGKSRSKKMNVTIPSPCYFGSNIIYTSINDNHIIPYSITPRVLNAVCDYLDSAAIILGIEGAKDILKYIKSIPMLNNNILFGVVNDNIDTMITKLRSFVVFARNAIGYHIYETSFISSSSHQYNNIISNNIQSIASSKNKDDGDNNIFMSLYEKSFVEITGFLPSHCLLPSQ